MSTNYTLLKSGTKEVFILEHSNLFDLIAWDDSGEPCADKIGFYTLTLDQLKQLNQNITNIISYFDFDYEKCEVSY